MNKQVISPKKEPSSKKKNNYLGLQKKDNNIVHTTSKFI